MLWAVIIFFAFLLAGYLLDKKQDKKLDKEFESFFEIVPKIYPEDLECMLKDKDNVHIKKHMNDIFSNGNTLLIEAVLHNSNPDVAEIFIKLGANVNGKDKNGRTALYYACIIGDTKKNKIANEI